jgi:hypothetical protein
MLACAVLTILHACSPTAAETRHTHTGAIDTDSLSLPTVAAVTATIGYGEDAQTNQGERPDIGSMEGKERPAACFASVHAAFCGSQRPLSTTCKFLSSKLAWKEFVGPTLSTHGLLKALQSKFCLV